jgi:hypothetical protein
LFFTAAIAAAVLFIAAAAIRTVRFSALSYLRQWLEPLTIPTLTTLPTNCTANLKNLKNFAHHNRTDNFNQKGALTHPS